MDPTLTPTPVVVTDPAKDAVVAQVVDDGAKVETHAATLAEPALVGFDPLAIAQANPMLAFGLAILAVVGGGTGFKLWTKMSEQRHETRMKELEIEAQKAGLNGSQPPPCQVKQAEVDAKLAAIEARLGKVEKTSLALPTDFDGDELIKRLAKAETAIKRLASGGGK